jgi:hypothetical protein
VTTIIAMPSRTITTAIDMTMLRYTAQATFRPAATITLDGAFLST